MKILILFSFLVLPLLGAGQNAVIQGRVTYAGEPNDSILVKLYWNYQFIAVQTTDEEGYYWFAHLEAGNYLVVASYLWEDAFTCKVESVGSSETRQMPEIKLGSPIWCPEGVFDPVVRSDQTQTTVLYTNDQIGRCPTR